jgi:hypothetical protein
MKNLTLAQLKKWKPCNGQDWVTRMEKIGESVEWSVVVKTLSNEKEYPALNWIIGKRLEKLSKRQSCMFAYRCSHRALKHARKQDLTVCKKAISFAKQYALTGKVDRDAAWAAGASAWAVGAAASAAASAAAGAAAWAAARAAAGDAARAALKPSVDKMQKSALLLIEKMIDTTV